MRGMLWSLSITTALLLAGCGSGSDSDADANNNVTSEMPAPAVKTPLQDATGIPLDPVINVTFDTLMDPASICGDTVYLVAEATDEVVSGTVTLLDDNVTALYTTTVELVPGEVYTLVVTTGVQDILGNHPLSNLTSKFTVSDVARVVAPIAVPVADTVLDNEAVQFLLSTLGSMLGSTEALPLSADDLSALSLEGLSLNDLLAGVQAQNPAAGTVGELLGTEMSLETVLGLLTDKLPEGSNALAPLEAVIAQLSAEHGDLLGQSLTLGDILTVPTELLSLAPTDLSAQDTLSAVTNPLALLETVAQAVNGGGLVNDPILGPIIANVTEAGGLVLDGGVLTQRPGAAELAALVPSDMLELVNTILTSGDPVGAIEAILGGGDLLGLLTDVLGGDLAATLNDLVAGLSTDPKATLTDLLGLLGTLGALGA